MSPTMRSRAQEGRGHLRGAARVRGGAFPGPALGCRFCCPRWPGTGLQRWVVAPSFLTSGGEGVWKVLVGPQEQPPASAARAMSTCSASPPVGVRRRPDRGRALPQRVPPAPPPAVFCAPVSAHHRAMREDYGDKVKAGHWSRSPLRPPRERFELTDGRKPGAGAGPGARQTKASRKRAFVVQ